MGIGIGTIWRWVNQVQPKRKDCQTRFKITNDMVPFVIKTLQASPCLTQLEIGDKLNDQFNIKASRQCISRMLKRIGYSRLRCRRRGFSKKDVYTEKLEKFHKAYQEAKHTKKVIVSVDEVGFDHRTLPLYGYAPKGSKLVCALQTNCRKRTTVITAIDRSGNHYSHFVEGSTTACDFAKFLEMLPCANGAVVMMDNASIHKTELIQKVCEQRQFQPLYTPPYTPDSNPIENVFSVLKNRFRSVLSKDIHRNHIPILQDIMSTLDKSSFKKCFKRSELYVAKAIQQMKST